MCFKGSMFEIERRCTNLFYVMACIYLIVQWTSCLCWFLVTIEKWTWAGFTVYCSQNLCFVFNRNLHSISR